jgi:predicted nucleic acid-binding protein
MKVLVDTNILTRSTEPGHSLYQPSRMAVAALRLRGHTLCIVPQNLYEFWVVSTRPTSVNGLGKTAAETVNELSGFKSFFSFVADNPAIYPAWENIVATNGILGKTAHDARFIAAMQVHGISHLLTFNDADFRPYHGIRVVTPTQILSASPPL